MRKALLLKNNGLKKKQRPHNPMWFQIAATLRLHDLLEPLHIIMYKIADR